MTKSVNIDGKNYGPEQMFLISGPCVIENERTMLQTAEQLKVVSEKLNIPVIYKSSFIKDNRSSVEYYVGPGMEEGLKLLQKIKQQFGFPILSDIHSADQAKEAGEILDVIQIPAYLCMQTSLVIEAAKTGKAINLKHGQFIAPENMIKPLKKVESENNYNIMLTERGYTFGYNDLVVDPRSFYHLQQMGYPIIFDITHSIRKYGIPSADPRGSTREFLPVIARAGVAAGIDGLFIETHPNPPEALCDAASQLNIFELEEFLKPLIEIHYLEKKHRKS